MTITLPATPFTPNVTFEIPSSSNMKRGWRSLWNDNTGLILIIIAQLFGVSMNTCVKLLISLDPPVPILNILFVRMFFNSFVSISALYYLGIPHPLIGPPEIRLLLVFRGIAGFFGLFGMYFALQYLSLSDAVVLTFLTPTATAIAGYIFIKEAISRREILAGLFSLFGVILIARPESLFGPQPVGDSSPEVTGPVSEKGTPLQRVMAVALALVGVLGATGAFVTIRRMGDRAHTFHSMNSFSLWCCIISGIAMLVNGTPLIPSFSNQDKITPEIPSRSIHREIIPPSTSYLFYLLLITGVSIFGFTTQMFLTWGLQREAAGRATLGMYTQIIFATAGEKLFFHSTTGGSWMGTIGTIIILICAVCVALNKREKSPSDLEAPGRGIVHYHRMEHDDGDISDSEAEVYTLISRENSFELQKEEPPIKRTGI